MIEDTADPTTWALKDTTADTTANKTDTAAKTK